MLVCVSSGATDRYREDVLRAIGLPIGAELQFRYRKKYLSPALLKKIEKKQLSGDDILIVYADGSKTPGRQGDPLELVPVRFAKLKDTTAHGSTVSVRFTLSEFPEIKSLPDFLEEITRSSKGAMPHWNGGQPKGEFFLELEGPISPNRSTSLRAWEPLVDELAHRVDFADHPSFVFILGLMSGSEIQKMASDMKGIKIPSKIWPKSRERQLAIYHYRPDSMPPGVNELRVRHGTAVQPQGPTIQAVDSSYDLKLFRFRATGTGLFQERSWIEVDHIANDIRILTLGVEFSVVSEFVWKLGMAGFLIVGLILANLDSVVDIENTAGKIFLLTGGSSIAAVAAIFGLKKSV